MVVVVVVVVGGFGVGLGRLACGPRDQRTVYSAVENASGATRTFWD